MMAPGTGKGTEIHQVQNRTGPSSIWLGKDSSQSLEGLSSCQLAAGTQANQGLFPTS